MWQTQIESLLGVQPYVPGVYTPPAKPVVSKEDRTALTLHKIEFVLRGNEITAKQIAAEVGMDRHYISKTLRYHPDKFIGEQRKVGGAYTFFWRLHGRNESEEVS